MLVSCVLHVTPGSTKWYSSRMDEAEKYQLRVEAIAEKRRQQDEQEKVRREMEEEKLRLQQLKRKSLRDQWLMEGAPLSPTSLAAQSPHSPLWGSQAQEMEKHIDKLQAESQRLADESEKELLEDGQAQQAVKVSDAGAGTIQDVVQNGETKATATIETSDAEVNITQSPLLDGTAVVLTNGGGAAFKDDNHEAKEPFSVSEGVLSMRVEPGLSLAVPEAEPGHVPEVNLNGGEDEGTLVMRAECVIVTDEADDAPEDNANTPEADEQESVQEMPLPHQGVSKDHREIVEEVIKTETAPETFTQPDRSTAPESAPEAQLDTGAGDVEGDIETNESAEAEAQGTQLQLQPPATALEGTAMASVPVYSETQPSAVTPIAEVEAVMSPEGAQDPVTVSDQFQEVPLADPHENQRTEAVLAEQEPLLSQVKAPSVRAEAAAAAAEVNSPVNTDTHSPVRARQGEETEAPKRKTCQCCSVM
ncbi:paralemmin-3 isoform X2 [Solea solea]|uniref:paralemmin-3 isoform X2 n=1 Tax=Solea solea TaxID=90069 RepID=UPI00272A88FC|nr:paralemmin-3 isoform X2 [Solea solea]